MNLSELLKLTNDYNKKKGITEERLREQLPKLRDLIAFFREYPDLFIDYIKGENSTFKFFFYQRVFLRVVMRHRFVYATFSRGYSKSFLSMMVLMLRCILYPGCNLFITTGGKEQAASITVSKIEEICQLIPSLGNEINWARGVSKKSRDDVHYIFKNGSQINILAATERSRGQRRTGGLMEECVLIDQDALNEIIIPTTNVNRLLPDGSRDKDETVNKSQIYITTAGYKDSFAYDKLIELLIQSIIDPDEVMIIGGTYSTPITEGLLDEDFVEKLKMSGTFNEDSFDREYGSHWAGDADKSYFSAEKFDKHRVLHLAEYEYTTKSAAGSYYTLGVDVGRKGCTTEVTVIKTTPQVNGAAIKSVTNFYSFEDEHFGIQAIKLKRLYYQYKARRLVIDGNGLGIGLIDEMVVPQVDPDTGDILPSFGIYNDDEGFYKKFKKPDTEADAIYIIKANAPINTEAYSYTQSQISSGKIRFLIDENSAKSKLMETKVGQNMTVDKRNEYLLPYVCTSILKEEMMNLVESNEGVNIILKQNNRKIKKDRFSSFIYGLYYIKQEEDLQKKKKKRNIQNFMFFN